MALKCRWFLFIWQTCQLMFRLSGVNIEDIPAVTSSSSNQTVTLPCIFHTSNPNSEFNVRWKKNNITGPSVLTREFSGIMIAGESFKGRVNLTGRASLVLNKPKLSDSSIYTCSVTIPDDVVKTDCKSVLLTVNEEQHGKPSGTCSHSASLITSIMTTCILILRCV